MEERASVAVAPARPESVSGPIHVSWLGRVPYRDAWRLQRGLAAARADGRIEDQLLLLEHDPVLTLGRNTDRSHVRATPAELAARGIEVIEVERGGNVTYHGPGQLVAYPIIALHARGLLVRPFVRSLEDALIATCASFGVDAARRAGFPGCWCGVHEPDAGREAGEPGAAGESRATRGEPGAAAHRPRKVGALGLRVERGVTYHGIALNVTVALEAFELIDPCGLPDVASTSIAREAGWSDGGASSASVALAAASFAAALGTALSTDIEGDLPPTSDPANARRVLDGLLEEQ